MRFPNIKTHDLNKCQVVMPRGLQGEYNLLLLRYAEWQQNQNDTWLPFASRLEDAYPGFHYYEVQVAGTKNPLAHFLINESRRVRIAGHGDRAHVLTLYVDKRHFYQQLGITSEQDITLMLVGRNGEIVWRETGIWTPGKADTLDDALLVLTPLKESDP